jgi:hypothetical protein
LRWRRLFANELKRHRGIYDEGWRGLNEIEGPVFLRMSFDRFRALVLRLAIALKPLQDVFRSLPSARAMSFDRFRALALCLSIALDRSRYVFRSLALCLSIATIALDRSRSLSIALDRFRCLQIAADVSRYVCRSQPMSDTMSADRDRSLPMSHAMSADRDRSLQMSHAMSADRDRSLQMSADRCQC